METSVFVDQTRAISDCNRSLARSVARGHVKVCSMWKHREPWIRNCVLQCMVRYVFVRYAHKLIFRPCLILQVNLAALSKSELAGLFVNLVAGLPQIQRLSMIIEAPSTLPGTARNTTKQQNASNSSITQYSELIKGVSTRICGSKVCLMIPLVHGM